MDSSSRVNPARRVDPDGIQIPMLAEIAFIWRWVDFLDSARRVDPFGANGSTRLDESNGGSFSHINAI